MTDIFAETLQRMCHEECERRRREAQFSTCETNHAPNWALWRDFPGAELWQVVALSVDIDPDCIREYHPGNNYHNLTRPEEFVRRMKACCTHVLHGELKGVVVFEEPGKSNVSCGHIAFEPFAKFAVAKGWQLPPDFPGQNVAMAEKKAMPEQTGDLHRRTENTYLNIIGALLECISGDAPGVERHQSFKDQNALIKLLEEKYEGIDGLSKRNLQKYFPLARQNLAP